MLTGEKADVVDNEVQPEFVSQGWPLGEVGKVGTDTAQKQTEKGLSSKCRYRDGCRDSPSTSMSSDFS